VVVTLVAGVAPPDVAVASAVGMATIVIGLAIVAVFCQLGEGVLVDWTCATAVSGMPGVGAKVMAVGSRTHVANRSPTNKRAKPRRKASADLFFSRIANLLSASGAYPAAPFYRNCAVGALRLSYGFPTL
jgi:hypothetical protein